LNAVPARYRAAILAGAGLGLRPGELFGLRLDRVEFLKRRVRIEQQLVRVRGTGVVVGLLKTTSSYRNVPLPDHVANVIATQVESFGTHAELGLVFTNEWGRPIQQFPFSMMFANALRRASLPDWPTPHDLRHFDASTLIRSGASIKVIQAGSGIARRRQHSTSTGTCFPTKKTARAAPLRRLSPMTRRPQGQGERCGMTLICVTCVSRQAFGATKPQVRVYIS
jgi:integrase